ncbi:MAG: CDP-glycerol glycerophosphotransferase family protein [Fidelibacterota bacterium]
MPFKIVFDAYHLYHLPQFDPVIEILSHDDRFEIFASTSTNNNLEEKVLTEKILSDKNIQVIKGDNENERANKIKHLQPDVFICGWSRYPIGQFVTDKTLVGMIYHGIGVKPSYWKDNHKRLNVRFVEGPLRQKQLRNAGIETELELTGFTKLDPLFQNKDFNRENILVELNLDPRKKTILYGPTFYPSSMQKIWPELINKFHEFNIIVKPHMWVYFLDSFGGISLKREKKTLEKFENVDHIAVLGPEMYNIVPFLAASDLLITEASSTIYEMMALDKPVLLCKFFTLKWNHSLFSNRLYQRRLNKEMSETMTDFCFNINKPKDVFKVVSTVLNDTDPFAVIREKYKKEMLFQQDGKASERVIESILRRIA